MIPNDKKSALVAKFQSKNKTPKFNYIKPAEKPKKIRSTKMNITAKI